MQDHHTADQQEIKANAQQIAEHLAWLHPLGSRFELRCIDRVQRKARTWVGSDHDYVSARAAGESKFANCYVTLNAVKDDRDSATDAAIVRRTNLLIDVDASKPTADVNATDAEKQTAAQVGCVMREYLTGLGWPAPLHVDSGNGDHLTYAIDLAAEDDRVERLLHGLHAKWPAVDRKVFNASRITKLGGTLTSKTANPTAERPMRVAKLIDIPARVIVSGEQLDAAIADLPQPESKVEPKKAADVGGVIGRARRYLLDIEPAVSGKPANDATHRHGHDQTFHVACALVLGFDLSPDAAYPLLAEWNERCLPPWGEDELKHKLRDADAKPGERGYLLTATPDAGPVARWHNPQRIADRITTAVTLRFVGDTGYKYEGECWRELSDGAFTRLLQGACEDAADGEYKRLKDEPVRLAVEYERAKRAGDVKRAQGVRKELDRQQPALLPDVTTAVVGNVRLAVQRRCMLPDGTRMNTWIGGTDAGYRLRLVNGLLDPAECVLWPHDANWFSTVRLPVKYDAAATCPKWEAALSEMMEGDSERVAVIQEVFGACLDPTLPVKFFAGFVGDGHNGKSVVLAVLRALLGAENVSAVGLDELAARPFAAWGLYGKLANVAGDQSHFDSHDEGRLKTLTGGDVVCFERKNCDPVFDVNTARILFACNTPPTFGDKTNATWNRAQLVPFTWRVPADRDEPAMLRAGHWAGELPGVLNWALAGLARLRANSRFTHSKRCEALKAEHRVTSNPALEYLSTHYTPDADGFVPSGDLYDGYRNWCANGGYKHVLTARRFGEEVKRQFPAATNAVRKVQGKPARGWAGMVKAVTEGYASVTHLKLKRNAVGSA